MTYFYYENQLQNDQINKQLNVINNKERLIKMKKIAFLNFNP